MDVFVKTILMLYVLSIVPIVIYLIIIKIMDGFSLAKPRFIALCLIYGMLGCGVAYLLSHSVYFFAPLVEEVLKGLLILYLVMRKRIAFFIDALIYGAAVGGGFALIENIIYITHNGTMYAGTAMFRGFDDALMHIGCTALVSVLLIIFSREVGENRGKNPGFFYVLAFIPSILLHYVHNLFLLTPPIQLAAIITLFVALFIFICEFDEKLIYRWLDVSIENDISLLSEIKQGRFADTNAGKYMLTLKSNFKPEVFFDMYCYVSLYLELLIAAKSNLILRDVGMVPPYDDAVRQSNQEKIAELKSLQSQIGPTAILALRPIVQIKNIDKWALDLLG